MPKPSTKRRTRLWGPLALAGLCLGLAAAGRPALADPPIRCSERVVDRGMRDYEVRRLCGEPDGITPFEIERFVGVEPGRRGGFSAGTGITYGGERWDYAPRNGRLSRTLLFEAGRLVRIVVGED